MVLAPMEPSKTLSGKQVLVAVLGLTLTLSVGVMLIAIVTQRPAAPPPMPRSDTPTTAR
jgi:hypothetical protein